MKTFQKVLVGCGSGLLMLILLLAIVGFMSYRRLYPSPPRGAFPDSAAKYKLVGKVESAGNLKGDMESHSATYSVSENGELKKLLYTVWVWGGGLECDEPNSERVLKDKSGKEIGRTTLCQSSYKPQRTSIGFRKDGYFVQVRNDFNIKNPSSTAEMMEFIKAVPYYSNIDFPSVDGN